MNFNKVTTQLISQLQKISGAGFVFSDGQSRTNYGHDETDFHLYLPEVVVKPRTPE